MTTTIHPNDRSSGERLVDAVVTDVMSDPALQSLMAAEFKISALTADLQAVTSMRSFFCDAFITAESSGEAGYCIKAKFESLSQMQNAHSALVRLLQSEKAGAA